VKNKTGAPTFSPTLSQQEQQKNHDYEWAVKDADIQRKYAGKVVVVYRGKILGAGKNFRTAWAAAQRRRDCPPKDQVAMPVIPFSIQVESAG
jgi:hypothetical protein